MFEVRVEADFAAAHFLADYHGKCERLHGHNYKVYAHIRGNALDAGGMLMDFAVVKNHLREICAALDHSNLNDFSVFEQNPSAERIAQYIFRELNRLLKTENSAQSAESDAVLFAIDVFETPTSRARYTE